MASQDPMPRLNIWRLGLLALLVAALAYGFSQGWHEAYTWRNVSDQIDHIQMRADTHLIQFMCLFFISYVVIVALSLPGASILTLLGGFIFGWAISAPLTIGAAAIGASIIFLVAKTALGDVLRARAGPFLDRIAHGFQRDAFNYLLFLRLVPAFPFWLVNIAPAFLGVSLRTFFFATLIGIVPGTFAFSYAGASLDSVFETAREQPAFQACIAEEEAGSREMGSCDFDIGLFDLVTLEIVLALIILGAVALIPVLIRRFTRNRDMEGLQE